MLDIAHQGLNLAAEHLGYGYFDDTLQSDEKITVIRYRA